MDLRKNERIYGKVWREEKEEGNDVNIYIYINA